jgi:DNA-binding NarL/FixJ family response regulator
VLIVDDHAGFRRAAVLLLRAAGYEVVGEAPDGATALAAAAALRPDLVLLDVQLPDLNGFAVAKRLAREYGPIVVLVSTRTAADYARRLAETPARGFITKSEFSARTLAALLDPAA